MGLDGLDIKIKYDSDKDDILNDFYIPVLSNSTEYCRLAGFFSSNSLAMAAIGMENFIKNGGVMKLICSAKLSKEDFDVIAETEMDPVKFIENSFIDEFSNISNNFVKDHVAALGWMLANNRLEIKIAIPENEWAMFHSKVGILRDNKDNLISFTGSNNETANGWKYNIERFKVFKSWDSGQKGYVLDDINDFKTYWNNLCNRTKVISIPKAIKEKMIDLAPENIEKFILNEEKYPLVEDNENFQLRSYQLEAISNWVDNKNKGLFEMATGTGKTFTALACFKTISNQETKLLTIIACPQSHLIDQWKKDVKKFHKGPIIIASSKIIYGNLILKS